MEVHTIPWYLSNPIFLPNEIDEVVSQMMTQLSACTMTPKLMDNGMKNYLKYKIQKIKLVQIRCLTKNTLSTQFLYFFLIKH